MRNLSFLGSFGLVTLSGCLWFLAVTPFDLSALAWIAAVPMLFAVDRAPTWRQALLLGWWAGVVETAGGFYWLIDVMQRFADFPWVAAALVFLLFCAARALIFLLFTGIVCGIRSRRRVPMTILAPIVMVGCELVVPQLFPCGQWISQAWHPLVIQISELTGPLGVTALLMLVNGALHDLAADRRAALLPALSAAALLAAALVFGAVRMRQVDAIVAHAPRLKIGLVQPNFPYTVDAGISREEAIRQLTALQDESSRLQDAGAQLIVWSEGSYPVTLPRNFSADFPPGSAGAVRRGFDVPVIIGADMYDEAHDAAFNSAILLDGEGRAAGHYDKVRLLAFGEYIPAIDYFPWLRKFLPANTGQFTAGQGPGVLTLHRPGSQDWKLGPVICYEDILQGFLRGVGQLHPNLLVNLTSDSWFGAESEPWEHLALAVFAGVELRVGMVRAVNSGVSALIDPNGRLLEKTYANDPYRNPRAADGILVTAPVMPGAHTVYVAVGNLFAYLCIAATLILGAIAARTQAAVKAPADRSPS
ncbi:MAG TPA: apolipoprotein N-acyltransferase [Steroidobacteraceae bacterium]|nr:apolipoprotein N-acyltransferase [Steroidobacteraceae bacterium]